MESQLESEASKGCHTPSEVQLTDAEGSRVLRSLFGVAKYGPSPYLDDDLALHAIQRRSNLLAEHSDCLCGSEA
jgi:hypothetical protein